jgi:hypothetical protein
MALTPGTDAGGTPAQHGTVQYKMSPFYRMSVCNMMNTLKSLAANPFGKLKTLKKKVQKTHIYKNFVMMSRGRTRKQNSAAKLKR